MVAKTCHPKVTFGVRMDAVPEQIGIWIHTQALRWSVDVPEAEGRRIGQHRFNQPIHIETHNIDARIVAVQRTDSCEPICVIGAAALSGYTQLTLANRQYPHVSRIGVGLRVCHRKFKQRAIQSLHRLVTVSRLGSRNLGARHGA